GLALALDMTGDRDGARRIYDRALSVHPNDLRLRNNHGLSLALAGETDEAVRILEGVLRDDRAGPAQRQNLALAYMLAGNERDATRVLAIDHDVRSLETVIDYLRTVAMLAPADRLKTLVAGTTPPRHDTDRPANRGYEADAETRVATAKRIVGVTEEAEPAPEPKPEPEPEPHRDADLTDIPLMAPGEGWSLQIAAYRRASELVEGWDILREEYHDIIGDLEPRRTEIDFGDRPEQPNGFFYRLNAGPLTSLEEANERCQRMRERLADCWVRPPEDGENTEPTPGLRP
ncbi:MAG: SPOR domain-containing protein, partial [Sphingomonadales bacterium]